VFSFSYCNQKLLGQNCVYYITKLRKITLPSELTLPYLTSPHLTLPHVTSRHLTSRHVTSPHLTSPHLTSPHLTSPHLTSLDVMALHCQIEQTSFAIEADSVPKKAELIPISQKFRSWQTKSISSGSAFEEKKEFKIWNMFMYEINHFFIYYVTFISSNCLSVE
jgi:hypothetical protein